MAKQKRSAQQLRLMILTELRSKTPFPEGFDIQVMPGPFGWDARCIPPRGVFAYSDCSETVRSVAESIRKKYDLG